MTTTQTASSLAFEELTPRARFLRFTEHVRRVVEAVLSTFWSEKLEEASVLGEDVVRTIDAARQLCLRGGKRLRPALVVASHRACQGREREEEVCQAATVLELLQTYLLIQDDWMDGDDIRRGGPSVHAALRMSMGKQADAAAILASDYVSALAQELLCSLPLPSERIIEAVREYGRMHREVVLGQILDVRPNLRLGIETSHDLKTGSYTVRGPLLLGAALAGASTAQRDALVAFATPLGIAFQLRDDLLGTFGERCETGKPVGNDLRAGKRTSIIDAVADDADTAAVVATVFGVPTATDSAMEFVVRRLEEAGIRRRIETRVLELMTSAQEALTSASLTRVGADLLLGAASVLVERTS